MALMALNTKSLRLLMVVSGSSAKAGMAITKAAGILCSCKKEPYYSLGIALVDTPAGNTVRAYNAEKTLCEILKPISHTDIQIITDAFKRYAGRKDKNIPLLSEYAHQLRVEKRLRPYLEVLL